MPLRVCLAGTFDPDFPRNRMLRDLLDRTGFEVTTCHVPLWGRREEHIVRRGRLRLALRASSVYPRLVGRFLALPRPDVVLVGYPGHFDLPLLAPLARRRGARVVWESFLSLYDTIVADRGLVAPRSPTARLAASMDRAACRLADSILVDTPQNGDYLAAASGVPRARFHTLWIGAPESLFRPRPEAAVDARRVLFYGSYIPLHGVPTIVRAAKLLEGDGVELRLIGGGQERPEVERLLGELAPGKVEMLDPVPLERLPAEIARATLCLGIFGTSDKARRVLPHKLFEALAVGRPVITADTPAVRGAFDPTEVVTVPAGDPAALAGAIRSLLDDPARREAVARAGHERYLRDYCQEALTRLLAGHLQAAAARTRHPTT